MLNMNKEACTIHVLVSLTVNCYWLLTQNIDINGMLVLIKKNLINCPDDV